MNIFDKTNGPKPVTEESIKRKIGSLTEPKLISFMSKDERDRLRASIIQVKGDGSVEVNGNTRSIYSVDSHKVFEIVNKISPSMCLAKWYNVSLHIPTGKTHSCYHPPAHKIPLAEIELDAGAIHNTKHKKEQRKKMLNGIRPSECSFCWDIEDSGQELSDRAYRSKDVYRPGILQELAKDGYSGNPLPRYVEVNFNQACNLKCAYCSPHLSTEWQKEAEKFGPYMLPTAGKHNDLQWMVNADMVPDNGPNNPYLKSFWDWFPSVYPTLQTFRMTGGEPLMDKNTFKVFDYVLDNPTNPDLHLSITSNCCPPGDQWAKFLTSLSALEEANAIDHFMLYCSLDSWGKQAEYIRNGLNFDTMYKNVVEFLKQGKKHSLTFIVTFNALSIPGWLEYVKNILRLRKEFNTTRQLIWFDVPMLMDPSWLSLKILPPEDLKVLEESIKFMRENIELPTEPYQSFKGFKDYEIDKVQRLYDWATRPLTSEEVTLARADFHAFYHEHDRRRDTDFKSTFPELGNLVKVSEEAFNTIKLNKE